MMIANSRVSSNELHTNLKQTHREWKCLSVVYRIMSKKKTFAEVKFMASSKKDNNVQFKDTVKHLLSDYSLMFSHQRLMKPKLPPITQR